MTFEELREGCPVCVLYKDEVRVVQGVVIEISQSSSQTVDVTIEEEDGVQMFYTIPKMLDVTYAKGLVISTSKEKIRMELENMKMSAESMVVGCNMALAEIG